MTDERNEVRTVRRIDWKRKLTSRKFWAALAEFTAMLVIALRGPEETASRVTALIMAGAAVIAFIVGEGLVDAAGAGTDGREEEKIPF